MTQISIHPGVTLFRLTVKHLSGNIRDHQGFGEVWEKCLQLIALRWTLPVMKKKWDLARDTILNDCLPASFGEGQLRGTQFWTSYCQRLHGYWKRIFRNFALI